MKFIDLNSDVGEGFGRYKSFENETIYDVITSANIACGYHGGDCNIMNYTSRICYDKDVEIGAHPGFPDLIGFGRRKIDVSYEEALNYCLYQIGALNAFAEINKKNIQHVKLHGALYNMAMKDYDLSRYIIKGIKKLNSNIVFLGLANSNFIKACKDENVKYANEVFADRLYDDDGNLVSRKIKGAVINDKDKALNQIKNIILYEEITTINGKKIKLKGDSICIHGDNDEALNFAIRIRNELEKENIKFKPLKDFI